MKKIFQILAIISFIQFTANAQSPYRPGEVNAVTNPCATCNIDIYTRCYRSNGTSYQPSGQPKIQEQGFGTQAYSAGWSGCLSNEAVAYYIGWSNSTDCPGEYTEIIMDPNPKEAIITQLVVLNPPVFETAALSSCSPNCYTGSNAGPWHWNFRDRNQGRELFIY